MLNSSSSLGILAAAIAAQSLGGIPVPPAGPRSRPPQLPLPKPEKLPKDATLEEQELWLQKHPEDAARLRKAEERRLRRMKR